MHSSMNALHHRTHPSVGSRNLSSERSVAASDKRTLAILYFVTANGLLSILAAMFATMLSSSAVGQYFWLAVCLVTFGLLLTGLVRLGVSDQANQPGDAH